jgi:hypothetical protein
VNKRNLRLSTAVILALTLANLVLPQTVISSPAVGSSDNGILVEEWHFDMVPYGGAYFGSSPAIADLSVNTLGSEPNSDLEIVTGSDEMFVLPDPLSQGVWRCFDSDGNLEWERGTQTDESRSSPAIVDLDGDDDLEIVGGTTSGWYVQVMDHEGNFVWTFPTLLGQYLGGPFVWPSSPAVADLHETGGLEVVIGNRWLGEVWCFDGDNTDGIDEGYTVVDPTDFPWPAGLGTEGIDWDVLWIFDPGTAFMIYASPAIGDVDNDGDLEVVIGSGDKYVYVLDGATGSLEWSYETGGGVYASAALANLDDDAYLEIVIGSTDGKVYCLDGSTGNVETGWPYATGGEVYSSAAIGDIDADGSLEIVVGSYDSNVYALDDSGIPEWTRDIYGAVHSSPALADRIKVEKYDNEWPMFRHDAMRTGLYSGPSEGLDIYIGSFDEYLYLIDGDDGSIIDRFETYGSIGTSPSVADVDGDAKLEIFFYDWGLDGLKGHTFWALEDTPITKIAELTYDEDLDEIIEVGEEVCWVLTIRVINSLETTITDAVVTDRFSAEIEIDEPFPYSITQGTVEYTTKGKSEKVFLTWTIGDLDPLAEATLTLLVSTDLTPDGIQEYTEPGIYELNSGAVLKGFIDSQQISFTTDPIVVEAYLPE